MDIIEYENVFVGYDRYMEPIYERRPKTVRRTFYNCTTDKVYIVDDSLPADMMNALENERRQRYNMAKGMANSLEKSQTELAQTRGELNSLREELESLPQIREQRARQAEARRIRAAREAAEHEAYMRRPDVIRARELELEKERKERERKNAETEGTALMYVLGAGTAVSFMAAMGASFEAKTSVCSTTGLITLIIGEAITAAVAYKFYRWMNP